jgi:Zn-dependent metalloprotease
MKAKFTLYLSLLFFPLWAQQKPVPAKSSSSIPKPEITHHPIKRLARLEQEHLTPSTEIHYDQLPKLDLKLRQPIPGPILIRDEQSQLPIYIEGEINGLPELRDAPDGQKALQYLNYFKRDLQVNDPDQEFVLVNKSLDDLGQTHWRFRQQYQGVEVYGAEVILHEKEGKINGFNGRYFATPKLPSVEAKVDASAALQAALKDLEKTTKVRPLGREEIAVVGEQVAKKQLVIYYTGAERNEAVLCWYLEVVPNLHGRWAYFIDAERGTILNSYSLLCKAHHQTAQKKTAPTHFHTHLSTAEAQSQGNVPLLDGKASAIAKDLAGLDKTIQTYQIGNTFFMIDATKDMFNPTASSLPQDPKGAIVTLDVRNTIDAEGNFKAFFFTSPNNTWNAPNAVSAHVNAGLVYDYYRKTFGRKSINNAGSTMRSYVNVPDEDGSALDNAFWNGDAMFYGNGGSEFRSLARALDIAGHEITHGIIQNTANLDYENEPGALNESFADIFGAMIDRDDWKMGEDVVLPSVFPSGALRDLANPNNGGRSLRDPGWQPAHYSERYTGTEDEGGVHINSGIVNRAFFLFATQVGKELAEQVYYTALSNYLTRSSRFVDARLAIVRAAREKGGEAAAKAAESAFETVGIRVGAPTAPPTDLKINPGTQFILGVKADRRGLGIFDVNKNTILELPITSGVLQKPTVSDDGSLVIFINNRKQLKYLELDWAKAQFDTGTLNSNRIWENVSLSRDGLRLAALVTDRKDEIAIVDLTRETNNTKFFRLYNPTNTQGVSSGNVVGADALEWDLSSETVVYDAYNEVPLSGFGTYNYWDMGLLRAWDKKTKTFGDGKIDKIINGLEEGENIGNPSFSKNTPYILSFDYIVDQNANGQVDDADDYFVLSTNLETGDIATVFENSTLGFPNYSTKDDFMIFNAESNLGDEVIAIAPLKTDKITPNAGPSIFKSGYILGTWFANGQRVLSSNRDESWPEAQVKIYPNPLRDRTLLELTLTERETVQLEISDVYGRVLYQQQLEAGVGKLQQTLNLQDLPAGHYLLRIRAGQKSTTRKMIKW